MFLRRFCLKHKFLFGKVNDSKQQEFQKGNIIMKLLSRKMTKFASTQALYQNIFQNIVEEFMTYEGKLKLWSKIVNIVATMKMIIKWTTK